MHRRIAKGQKAFANTIIQRILAFLANLSQKCKNLYKQLCTDKIKKARKCPGLFLSFCIFYYSQPLVSISFPFLSITWPSLSIIIPSSNFLFLSPFDTSPLTSTLRPLVHVTDESIA